MSDAAGYEVDFYAWANEQAALLRGGRLGAADIDNIAEELESMGRSEKRELVNRLTVLLTHMLKWQFQPGRRGASWEATIAEQRVRLTSHLAENPSLMAKLGYSLEEAYRLAIIRAGRETKTTRKEFPTACPWTWAQIMDEDFWPEG